MDMPRVGTGDEQTVACPPFVLQAQPLAVDSKGLGALLDLSERTIRKLLRAGRLPRPLAIGRRRVWCVEEIRSWEPTDSVDVGIDAPTQEWEKLLAPVPRPFYQSLFAAAAHHGVVLSGDPMDSYAYMGALTRILDLMRSHVTIR